VPAAVPEPALLLQGSEEERKDQVEYLFHQEVVGVLLLVRLDRVGVVDHPLQWKVLMVVLLGVEQVSYPREERAVALCHPQGERVVGPYH
jgi:hypothetical protein